MGELFHAEVGMRRATAAWWRTARALRRIARIRTSSWRRSMRFCARRRNVVPTRPAVSHELQYTSTR